MTKKHIKHPFLARRNYGQFHTNEWAVLGTNCGAIKELAHAVVEHIGAQMQIGYMDADHKAGDENALDGEPALKAGAQIVFTDKIQYNQINWIGTQNPYEMRSMYNDLDALLINGNHFEGQKQIVFIDPKKESSVIKRLDQITNLRAIVLPETDFPIPSYLLDKIEASGNVALLSQAVPEAIAALIAEDWKHQTSNLKGLVLAGGKSLRMGEDKTQINYHGKSQAIHVHDMLVNLCDEVFISVRDQDAATQEASTDEGINYLVDSIAGLGPFGAIMTAFRHDPTATWLVVASDLPFLNEEGLKYLISERDPSKTATAFKQTISDFPEPLITIWEPKSYQKMVSMMVQGYSCPRKVLINSKVKIVTAPDSKIQFNANTPEERDEAMAAIFRNAK